MTLPAFLYARFSSLEQGRGTSLKRQFENGREYAAAKGWLLDPEREISDKGRSAYHGANRAAGGALYEFERQAEKGFFRNGAVFVVEHFDRISRQGWEEVHAFLKLCVENGVSVATIDGDRFYPAGQRIDGGTIMEIVFKGEGAREEAHKKSIRGLKNWQFKVQAIQDGQRNVKIGLAPAWLDRDPLTNAHSENPHRCAVLREIFDLYNEGWGLPAIVKLLNGRKEPSWAFGERDKGNGWNSAYLHKLLTNRAVLGEYTPMARTRGGINETAKGIVVPDYYPQAISAEVFNAAEVSRSSRKKYGGRGETTISNLFSGSCVCSVCGGPMYFQSQQRAGRSTNHKSKLDGRSLSYMAGTDRSYLLCNNRRRSHGCDNRSNFRYEKIEPAILDAVLGVVVDDRKFATNDKVAELSASVTERERLIETKRQNLNSIVDSLAEFFVKALAQKAQAIEAEIEADEAQLAELKDELRRGNGGANPIEQLERVREVRSSLTSDDPDVRYAARARVRQALSRLVNIRCTADGVATVIVANGLLAWEFDRQGELLRSLDLRPRHDLHYGLTSGVLADNAPGVHNVLRRAKEARQAQK